MLTHISTIIFTVNRDSSEQKKRGVLVSGFCVILGVSEHNEWRFGMDKVVIDFLIRAKKETYAGKGAEIAPSRPGSHDLQHVEGSLKYIDTYLGGELFAGEEALWEDDVPFWAMNYIGRVTGEGFSGDFHKEALLLVSEDMPYRGPAFYENGDYTFRCSVQGDFDWFTGYEEVLYKGKKVYECNFHGGAIK